MPIDKIASNRFEALGKRRGIAPHQANQSKPDEELASTLLK
jgi:hypothetical protein